MEKIIFLEETTKMKQILVITMTILFSIVSISCNNSPEIKEDVYYNVLFQDKDGNPDSTTRIKENDLLVYPEPKEYDGYQFIRWNQTITNVSSDIVIYPIYEQIEDLYHNVYKVVFDGNGGTFISGEEIQYVETVEDIVYPNYEYYLKELQDFTQTIDEKNRLITMKANYKDLIIKDITPQEWLDSITFGWSYTNALKEMDNDHGKIFDLLLDSHINAVSIVFRLSYLTTDHYTKLNQETLADLKTIVDIAYHKGMYIIIAPYDYYGYEWSSLNYRNYDSFINVIHTSLKELAISFKDYNERVAFSFLVEPRDYEDNGIDQEAAWVLNEANQAYVEMVRKTGGNNQYRNVIITTGWSKYDSDFYHLFKMPEDRHTIVRVHSYSPFEFVHDSDYIHAKWTDKEVEYKIELLHIMQKIKDNFIDKGIPVYIGEFGSRDKGYSHERKLWIEYFLSLTHSYNIKMFIWESAKLHLNGEFTFSLINRETYEWVFPEYTDRLRDMIKNHNYIPFYIEAINQVNYFGEEIKVETEMIDMLTGEKKHVTIEYEEGKTKMIDGNIYASEIGSITCHFCINDYDYYFEIAVFPQWDQYDTYFELEIKHNPEGYLQVYILTRNYSQMRVDYDWYSSDESMLTISQYSTISIKKDGTCAIMAISKETGKYGVVEVTIENGEVVSFVSKINTIS